MKHLVTLTNCPICNSESIHDWMTVTDHMITKENFVIQECKTCNFHFTNPRPSLEVIGNYYKSEEYISHSSTNKGIINRLYNAVRSHTLKQKRGILEKITSGRKLLDIGSGTGHFANECSSNGWNVTGLEPDNDARQFALDTFNIVLSPIEELYTQEKNSFDVITMWHVLEHVYNLQEDVAQLTSLLKPNGYLIIAVPNKNSFDAQLYKDIWAAYDVPRHLYHFTEENMIQLISKFGLEHTSTLPMKFDSYYVSMLSEKYRKGSILKAAVNGLKSNRKAKDKNYGYSSQIYIFKK